MGPVFSDPKNTFQYHFILFSGYLIHGKYWQGGYKNVVAAAVSWLASYFLQFLAQ
jgi:hypothetical protein